MEVEIGKTYNYFDDGKIRESRRVPVTITAITTFAEADEETIIEWLDDVVTCDWLYATKTDYFIKGTLETGQEVIFVRTVDGNWFSLGYWAGSLDVDGSLTESL